MEIELLSDSPDRAFEAVALLGRYLRLPDAWAHGVPVVLPSVHRAILDGFPGQASPPVGEVVMALIANTVVGQVLLVPRDEQAIRMERMYVVEEHQRQGVARRLLVTAFAVAHARGCRRAVLDVLLGRGGAIRLHRRHGFASIEPYADDGRADGIPRPRPVIERLGVPTVTDSSWVGCPNAGQALLLRPDSKSSEVEERAWLARCMQGMASPTANPSGRDVGRDCQAAARFLQRFAATLAKRRSSVAADAPIGQIQLAALHHPDPFVRRGCLDFLDHYANETSTSIFALALRDPVELVRHAALHSVACETCRTEELCAADVVPHLVEVLSADPSPELRHKAIPVLLGLADRDPQARQAVERAADSDADALIRGVARRALAGEHVRARKAYQRRAKRRRTPA
jgi:GNAT superfamily N-acetyltransferase